MLVHGTTSCSILLLEMNAKSKNIHQCLMGVRPCIVNNALRDCRIKEIMERKKRGNRERDFLM